MQQRIFTLTVIQSCEVFNGFQVRNCSHKGVRQWTMTSVIGTGFYPEIQFLHLMTIELVSHILRVLRRTYNDEAI
jgi:hypothetical protein